VYKLLDTKLATQRTAQCALSAHTFDDKLAGKKNRDKGAAKPIPAYLVNRGTIYIKEVVKGSIR